MHTPRTNLLVEQYEFMMTEIFPAAIFHESIFYRFFDFLSTYHNLFGFQSSVTEAIGACKYDRLKRLIYGVCNFLNIFLVSLIAVRYAALDDGTCNSSGSKNQCHFSSGSLLANKRYCVWNERSQYCYFNEAKISLTDTVVIVFIIIIICTPFNCVLLYLAEKARQFLAFSLNRKQLKIAVDTDNVGHDEPHGSKTWLMTRFLLLWVAKVREYVYEWCCLI